MDNTDDLRFDNYVLANYMCEGEEIVKIIEIFPKRVRVEGKVGTWHEEIGCENIKPIALTHEVLENCGFWLYHPKSSSGNYYQIGRPDLFIYCKRVPGLYSSAIIYKEKTQKSSYVEMENVEYLHQLQNAYKRIADFTIIFTNKLLVPAV